MEPLSFARSTTRQCRVSSAQLQGIGAAVSYPIGTRCKFICRSGFHIENQPVDKRHFKKICSEGGKWKGPKCVRIKCADPSLQFTNNHNCTNGYKIGSECRYICPSSKGVVSLFLQVEINVFDRIPFLQIRTSTCQSNGVWSSSVVCELTVDDCPYPAPPRDLSVNCPRLIKKGN